MLVFSKNKKLKMRLTKEQYEAQKKAEKIKAYYKTLNQQHERFKRRERRDIVNKGKSLKWNDGVNLFNIAYDDFCCNINKLSNKDLLQILKSMQNVNDLTKVGAIRRRDDKACTYYYNVNVFYQTMRLASSLHRNEVIDRLYTMGYEIRYVGMPHDSHMRQWYLGFSDPIKMESPCRFLENLNCVKCQYRGWD